MFIIRNTIDNVVQRIFQQLRPLQAEIYKARAKPDVSSTSNTKDQGLRVKGNTLIISSSILLRHSLQVHHKKGPSEEVNPFQNLGFENVERLEEVFNGNGQDFEKTAKALHAAGADNELLKDLGVIDRIARLLLDLPVAVEEKQGSLK